MLDDRTHEGIWQPA